MDVVQMDQSLSMGWCLDCHRDPEPHLRPLDQVTNMNWDPATADYDYKADKERKRLPSHRLTARGVTDEQAKRYFEGLLA